MALAYARGRIMENGKNPTEYLTVKEVAGRLGVSTRTVKRWIELKKLAAFQPTPKAHIRIEASEVDRFIKDNTATSK